MGYSLTMKKMVEFQPKSKKQNKNGTYVVKGVSSQGETISKIVSKQDVMKLKL